MNVQDAAYATVHDYKGGSVSLAPRLGMSDAVLRGKVNPNNDRNVLSLAEASKMMGITGDHQILHALAAEHGYVLQPIQGDAAECLMSAVLASSAAKGDLAAVISAATADGVITPNELSDITRACAELQARVVAIGKRAAAKVQRAPGAK